MDTFYVKPNLELISLKEKLLGANPERENFIKKYTPAVIKATKGTGILPSITMAQMIIESSDSKGKSGQGITAVKANNFFGIKADKGWKGQKMAFNTPKDGKPVSEFRVYTNVIDSIKDHTDFLKNNSRYTKAGVFTAKTPTTQAQALAKAGYSEKPYPQYADGIMAIIKGYNLTSLDGLPAPSNLKRNLIITGITVTALGGLYYYNKKYKRNAA